MSGSAHTGYLHWRLAVERLASGMWTGMPVPELVRKIRCKEPRLRVKHGARREDAGKRLVAAAKRGGLTVYIRSARKAAHASRQLRPLRGRRGRPSPRDCGQTSTAN